MRILHVTPTYLPATRYGGPIHSVHGLCKALTERGTQAHVYTTNVDGSGVSAVPVGQPVVREGVAVIYFAVSWPRRIYRSPAMGSQLLRAVRDFDLVHIHSIFLWPGLAASRAAMRLGVPYVVSPRGMLVPELVARKNRFAKSLWLRMFDRKMLRHAAAVHLTSRREAHDLERLGMETSQAVVIPNGVDIPEFDSDSKPARDRVLYLGRLHPKKGVDLLLHAMSEVPGIPLVVAGDGEPHHVAELKRLAEQLGLGSRVIFTGHLDDEDKWRQYRRASLFVLPSVSENFGNVVIEAMAAGCPVLVSPGVGLAETVARKRCGRVVPREPAEIASAVRELLGQAELRGHMSVNATQAAAEFGWATITERYVSAYQDILSRHVPTARGIGAK